MYKGVDIILTEPICSCDERNLRWSIPVNDKGNPFLVIHCGTCKTRLEVPTEQFKARFMLNKLYPAEQRQRELDAQPPPPPKVEKTKPGDLIDFMSHLKKRRAEDDLPS